MVGWLKTSEFGPVFLRTKTQHNVCRTCILYIFSIAAHCTLHSEPNAKSFPCHPNGRARTHTHTPDNTMYPSLGNLLHSVFRAASCRLSRKMRYTINASRCHNRHTKTLFRISVHAMQLHILGLLLLLLTAVNCMMMPLPYVKLFHCKFTGDGDERRQK